MACGRHSRPLLPATTARHPIVKVSRELVIQVAPGWSATHFAAGDYKIVHDITWWLSKNGRGSESGGVLCWIVNHTVSPFILRFHVPDSEGRWSRLSLPETSPMTNRIPALSSLSVAFESVHG